MFKEPESIQECVYFTNRTIGKGKVTAWALKEKCMKCKEGLMGKPRDPKTGKPKIRAKEYECPKCHYRINDEEYENTLTANIKYTCPYCNHNGETQVPFQRKKVQIYDKEMKKKTVDSLRFQCNKCSKNIDITKKLREV